jgi:hypothetical protein
MNASKTRVLMIVVSKTHVYVFSMHATDHSLTYVIIRILDFGKSQQEQLKHSGDQVPKIGRFNRLKFIENR